MPEQTDRIMPSTSYVKYDSKPLKLETSASFYDQAITWARSPSNIASSFYNDFSWKLLRDFLFSLIAFCGGWYGPKLVVLPLIGGVNHRPIPYQVTQAGDVLLDLTLANDLILKSDVVFPSGLLIFVSIWCPIAIVFIVGSFFPLIASTLPSNNPLHNVHAGVCTVLMAVGISEFITQTFKFYVGRLRPNFYAMCGFDKDSLSCTNGEEMEMEARMSFPSGHSSLSFCGMTTLVLFFLARVGLRRLVGPTSTPGRSKVFTFLSFVPFLLSFWCATSRLVDNWHHPSDIIAGSILGSFSALISYHIWFPDVFSQYAGIPLSVIQNGDGAKACDTQQNLAYNMVQNGESIA